MLSLLALLLTACAPKQVVDPAAAHRVSEEVDGLRGELVAGGPLAERVAGGDGADLVLLYGGELRGELGPCGCDARPRGGLARIAAFRDAVAGASPDSPVLTVDGGGFLAFQPTLDGSPGPQQHARNTAMGRALALLAPDALNLSWSDVLALSTQPDGDDPGLPIVSAHVTGPSPWELAPYVLVEAGEHTVAITGITEDGPSWMSPRGWDFAAPVAAVQDLELRAQADVVVLLSHGATDAARTLSQAGAVDLVVETADHRSFDPPFRVGAAAWVRSHAETLRVGELRVHLGEEGGIARALDRKIDLDEAVPEVEELAARARQVELELGRLERFR